MDFETGSVEAFLDLGSSDAVSHRSPSYSAGYRLIETGEVICAVQLPVSVAEEAILRRSRISIVLTPSGVVEVSAGGSAVNEQIDGLIARMLDPANLRMEEATASDLNSLLLRLRRSISLVTEAIAQTRAVS